MNAATGNFFAPAGKSALRILVVDDDRNTRDILLEALALFGARVRCAASVSEARAILARSELKKNTVNTRTDPEELITEFRRVRAEGYAIIDQELEIGLCSIAVPIDNDRGETVAAINIGAPAALVPAAEMKERYLPLLKETQTALRPLLRR